MAKNRVVFVGEPGSGKTQLIERYIKRSYQVRKSGFKIDMHSTPIYNTESSGTARLNRVSVFDFDNTKRNAPLLVSHIEEAATVVICIDSNQPQERQLRILEDWLRRLQHEKYEFNIFIAITKLDCLPKKEKSACITFWQEIEKLKPFPTIFTSAKENFNVDALFGYIKSGLTSTEIDVLDKEHTKVWQNTSGSIFKKATALLEDYTKSDSLTYAAVTFFGSRNHVKQVTELLLCCSREEITNVEHLLDKLHEIKLANEEGALARRINFIERHLPIQSPSEFSFTIEEEEACLDFA